MDAIDWGHHTDHVWLIAGVCLMALETVGITGVGLMFAGLGAVVAGAATHSGVVGNDAYVTQCIIFVAATAVFSLVLWKPMQKFHSHKRPYSNIIGDTAYAGSNGLHPKTGGEVTWSGTIMKAELAPGCVEKIIEAGSQVLIVDIKGATLIVKPKE